MKVVLTIAGSDPSGGAGIQADLKTFEAFGVFGTSVITVLTAQNTTGVRDVYDLPLSFIRSQLDAIREDFEISAVKVGMLYSHEIITLVADFLKTLEVPVVIDPVAISKAGSPLLQDDAIVSLSQLFQYASVITPNQHEAKRFFDYQFGDTGSLEKMMKLNIPILIKNQKLDLPTGSKSVDQLINGHQKRIFQSPMVETRNLHGTGCSYSSAIAANLALGLSLEEAIERSKNFIYQALVYAPDIGHGPGPINHKKGGESVATA